MRAPADLPRGQALALAAVGAFSLSACGNSSGSTDTTSNSPPLPQGSDTVQLDPADFTVDVTNRFWPMQKGDRWVYEERDEQGRVTRDEVTVLDRTETIN